MKIKGFFQDVSGASRVTKARLDAFHRASLAPVISDPIGETAREWHPGTIDLVVTEVRPTGKTAKTVRLARPNGKKLPPFYAGQYLSLDLTVDGHVVSRPYSISSAPWQARQEKDSFVEITVKRAGEAGFIANYINDELKPGDRLQGRMGCGQFYYEPLRDAKKIVALAGGVGVTPFAAMAKEIAHGGLNDVDLTILYGSVSSDDILLKDELDALEGERVHVVHVLSGENPGWTGETGFLSADLIQKYSRGDASYFICGPQAMYRVLREELKKLAVPRRRLRFEVFGQAKDVTQLEGYPQDVKDKSFTLTVVRGIQRDEIPAKASESLAVALERAGIRLETGCRSGECGLCRSKVLAGQVFLSPENDGRRAADKDFGYVHACAAYPLSDVTIKIPIL